MTERTSVSRAQDESLERLPLDALIFDLDGLIVDTESVVHLVWLSVYERHGCSFTEEEWSHAVGGEGDFNPLETLHERSRSPVVEAVELLETIESQIEVRLEGITPLPGVFSWMREARMLDVKVGVASNSPREWVEARLTQVGLRDLVEAMSCRGESSNAKPAPDIYLTACSRLDVSPHRAVAVEDSRTGVAAAKAAGLRCIAVPNHLTRHHDLSAADLIVDSLASVGFADTMKRFGSEC
jgi:beta-phosphoglucomutase-like phosphatase (HAD superfamily)